MSVVCSKRANQIEEKLSAMGVKSVKLSFSPGHEGAMASSLSDAAMTFLEKFIAADSVVDVSLVNDTPQTVN